MISLIIDTCNFNLLVALIKDNEILNIYNSKVSSDLSEHIFPIMEDLFKKSNVNPQDIDTIMVANGPGSFTGIRIGVTIAKTYAWAIKTKIIPFSSLELMATTNVDEKLIVPIIDARRNFVYAGVYDKKLNSVMNDCYINKDELVRNLKDNDYIFVSYDDFEDLNTIKPELNVLKIFEKYKNCEGINPHEVNPNYLKMTEAEMNLKKHD